MRVEIDGQDKGRISNLDEQMMVSVGSYEPGIHSFRLTEITGYMIDQQGGSQRLTQGGASCAGQFYVNPFQTYYALGAMSPNGTDYQCAIQ